MQRPRSRRHGTASASSEDLVFGSRYGGVADAVKDPITSVWNAEQAHDNVPALSDFFDDMLTQGKDGFIPRGNWAYGYEQAGTGALIEKVHCSGLHLKGAGYHTNLVFLTRRDANNLPVRRQGINFGGNANWTSPEAATVTLTADTDTNSLILPVSNTAAMFVGEYLFLSDRTQMVPYHGERFDPLEPNTIMYCLSCYVRVREIIDGTHVLIEGTPEFDFTAGTKVACLQDPNIDVSVENLRFSYCKENSPRGGAFSAINLIGNAGLRLSNIFSEDATSRCITVRRGLNYDFTRMSSLNTDPELGSFMTVSNMAAHGKMTNLRSVSGTHLLDFGGGITDPASHFLIDGVEATSIGGGVIGSHKSAHHLYFRNLDIRGIDRAFSSNPEDDPGDVGSAVTMRGDYCWVENAYVCRVPIAYRSNEGWRNYWTNCEADRCGRGIVLDNCDGFTIEKFRARNCLYYGFNFDIHVGPNQNHALMRNIVVNDFQVLDGEPMFDGKLALGGGYTTKQRFTELGDRWTNMSRNGKVMNIVGVGEAQDDLHYYIPAPTTERAGQLVGPLFPITPTTSALSAVINSIAGVTKSYKDGELLPIPGGTIGSGGEQAVFVVTKLKLISIDIKYGGLLNVVGNEKTMGGGVFDTPAKWIVDSVDGSGTALTGHISDPGIYTVVAPTLTQASTTGAGKNISVTTVGVINGGSRNVAGDIVTVQGGHIVTVIDPGPPPTPVKQWPKITIDAPVGPNGVALTGTIFFGGEFYDLPGTGSTGGGLSQNGSTGAGINTRWVITGSVNRGMQFENAVWAPLEVAVYIPGSKYSVTPGNPVTPISDFGEGVTLDVTWGSAADLGDSPRANVLLVGGTTGSIGSLGPKQNVTYRVKSEGTWTLVKSALISLPNGGSDLRLEDGMTFDATSNGENPTGWDITNITKADGTPLRVGLQGAITTKTNGTVLTAANIASRIIGVNAADNLADNYQLPTGTNMSAGFKSFIVTDYFDFSIINSNATAGATATVTTNTDWTLLGNMVVAINSSGAFRATRTGATTWSLFRLG